MRGGRRRLAASEASPTLLPRLALRTRFVSFSQPRLHCTRVRQYSSPAAELALSDRLSETRPARAGYREPRIPTPTPLAQTPLDSPPSHLVTSTVTCSSACPHVQLVSRAQSTLAARRFAKLDKVSLRPRRAEWPTTRWVGEHGHRAREQKLARSTGEGRRARAAARARRTIRAKASRLDLHRPRHTRPARRALQASQSALTPPPFPLSIQLNFGGAHLATAGSDVLHSTDATSARTRAPGFPLDCRRDAGS